MSKKLFSKVFILLLVVGLLFAVAPTKQAQAEGGTLVFEVGTEKTYTTLADAIAAVPTNLTEVTYVLYSDQSLTATSATAPDLAKGAGTVNLVKADGVASVKLTLDGAYTGKFVALGAQLNFKGLTLANYKANGEGTDPWEFAYLMVDAASVNFDGCTIINGILISIHAVFDDCLFDSQPRYYPNLVDGKDYSLDDYALWIHNFGNVVVKNSTFQNWAYGGIKSTWNRYATGANLSLTLQDNTFVNIGHGGEHTIANLDGAVSVTITGNLVIDSYTGGATTEQAALLEVDTIDPEPTIFVQNNIWAAPSVVYVDDGWASVPIGDDPDDAGPAIAMGYDAFATIQEGIAAVGAGGTVNVYDGVYNPPATITLDKAISIIGPTSGEAKIIGAGGATNKIFNISTSDVTIQYLTFTLAVAPTAGDAMINATEGTAVGEEPKTNINILDNEIYVDLQAGAMTTWQAQAIYIGRETTASKVNGNTIYNTRSGLVVAYNSALEIKDNVIYNTKGGIMNYTGTVADADNRVMTGNSWGTTHNEWDIVWNSGGGPYVMDMDKYVLQLSIAQSDARVVSLMTTGVFAELTGNRSHVYVNAVTGTGTETLHPANGNVNLPYKKIKDAIDAVVPGGKVYVAAGTYAEQLTINKAVTLLGPNAGISAGVTPGMRVPEATVTFPTGLPIDSYLVSITSDNVTIDGFDFTYQEYLIALRPTLIGAEGVDNLTIVNNRFFGGEVAVEFVPTTTQPYSVALLIEDNYVDSGPFVNSRYNRGFYIYGTGGVIKNNVVLNTSIGIQILPHREPTGGTVEGNVVSAYSIGLYQNNHWADSGAWSWKDNTVTMALNDRLGLKAQVNSPYTADVTFRGVHLINYGIYGGTVPPVATFEGNSIDGASVGSVGVIGVDAIRINSTDSPFVPGTTATFRENSFINYTTAINNIAYGSTSVIVDAIENWWGSIAGPAAGTIVGTAEYAPWCGDEICSFLVYPMLSTGLQASIDATPAGGTLYVPAGTYTDGDVDGYTVGGKTIILGDGVIIQNSSPCFTVTGSYTTITTESIGGATCVPTYTPGEAYGSSGIDVNGGLSNIVIEGIYFDTDQVLEALGVISFNGAVSDVLVNDNYFHVSSSIVYDGIIFAQQPAGLVEIKGNLFEMPNMYGCAVNNFYGTSTIDAKFNSFGSMAGHPASVPGGRVCTNVDYSNFTHADVYLESSATPWANQEVVGQEFTLTVKANLTEVTGAKFTLKYDPALVALDETSLTNLSGFSAAGLNMFEVDETLGLITFNASTHPAITGTAYPLFRANFTASAVGAALFEVDALTDEFSMFPGYASSSNVYGYTLLPVTVDLIQLPTVASTFGDSYYLVGEAREFTITVTNHDTVYAFPELRITIPAGLTLKYGGTDYTGTLVVDLENLAVGEEVIIDLTATFTAPFNTTAAVLGVKLVDALPTEEELVNTSFSANAYTKPSVTIGSDPYFLVGVPGDFSVTIDNPPTGRNYGDTIVFDIVIANHAVADISAVSCSMGGFTWNLIGTLVSDGAGNVKARIVGDNGYFTVPADFHPVIACSITYATPGTYEVSGYMVEAIPTPERIVSDSYSATTQVYIQPVITSTDLDGPFQAGLAQGVTLTITNPSPIPEPFDLVFTLPDGTTILYNGVTYTCSSTGCPAIPLVAGAVPGDIGFTITFPVGFVGGTADISVSLYDRDTVGAPSPLATLNVPAVVVYANVASVTGTVSMQGRTTRAGVLFTLAGSFDTYTATSINTLSNNVSFTNLASGVYAITVEQARYLDITIAHGATIDLAELQAIVNLELRAGDANDDNYINGGDASIVGGQYGTGTIADQGDINFDNKVNIQDLALVGGNFDFQSANPTHPTLPYAYGTWMK